MQFFHPPSAAVHLLAIWFLSIFDFRRYQLLFGNTPLSGNKALDRA